MNELATSKKIVKAIQKRSEGMCERCGGVGCDPHHLLEGSNKKATETIENVLWVCRECHDYLHLDENGIKENHGYKLDYQAWLLRNNDENEARRLMGGKLLLDKANRLSRERECYWLRR